MAKFNKPLILIILIVIIIVSYVSLDRHSSGDAVLAPADIQSKKDPLGWGEFPDNYVFPKEGNNPADIKRKDNPIKNEFSELSSLWNNAIIQEKTPADIQTEKELLDPNSVHANIIQ